MKRLILDDLLKWKARPDRKPLIIKGVRQVGKTFILKEFGKTAFPNYHYVNFEQNQKAILLFKENLDPKHLLNELSFLLNTSIDEKNDLLIFDEIQACPRALTSLKYFVEQLPELALCCAGSLLGLHLNDSSFPVGKIDLLHMYPMTFAEFLLANDEKNLLHYLENFTVESVYSKAAHNHLWEQLKMYFITGGLPEVVYTYLNGKENVFNALNLVRQKQNELIFGYYADIVKHSGKVNAMHIDRVWRSVPAQLMQSQDGSAKRFHFKDIVPGIDRYQRLVNVFDWLLAAELIIKVSIIEHVEIPLLSFTEDARFKLYMFDIGILGAMAELTPQTILEYHYGTYKGYFAENFIAQEFIANGVKHLYSWQNNRTEVEFLRVLNDKIIPIEVKSGWITRSQSLNKFAEKYQSPYRAVFSANPPHIDIKNKYHHYPLYMAHWFPAKNVSL
jgi:predicted AAA+ superfamily ATPase